MDLAGKSFWDDMWSGAEPYRYTGPIVQFHDLAVRFLKKDRLKSVIELGAAPGNHLVYFNKQFGYRPTALDYISDDSIIRRTFDVNEMSEYTIYNCDMFDFQLEIQYDLVFSSGLVEHFEDGYAALDKHLELVKSGGIL